MTLSFHEYLIAEGLALNTIRDYDRELEGAREWFTANGYDLAAPLPSQLAEYASTRPNTPSVRAHLRAALGWWWTWQEVPAWPKAIRVPAGRPMTCMALEPDEARDLVKTAMGWWREGIAILLMMYLGLRNQEVAGVRWDGFDADMAWYTLVGKGNRVRTIPVHPIVVSELAGNYNGGTYIFEGRQGRAHVSHGTIWNWVNQVTEAAGLDIKVWPHRLRHTALATMNDAIGDLRTVQTFAGHARPETTSGYTRTTAARLRTASDALDYF